LAICIESVMCVLLRGIILFESLAFSHYTPEG
jgi:hypothetical protein